MLTFRELEECNNSRMIELESSDKIPFNKDKMKNWSLLEWCGAMAGEAGEACNLAKKIKRGEDIPLNELAKELADVVIYADLIAQKMNFNLEKCILEKFNEKSKLWKCNTYL